MIDAIDTEQINRVHRKLDEFVEHRCRRSPEQRAEDAWEESDRRHKAQRDREIRLEWFEYEMHLAQSHAEIAEQHTLKAAKLLDDGGVLVEEAVEKKYAKGKHPEVDRVQYREHLKANLAAWVAYHEAMGEGKHPQLAAERRDKALELLGAA